MFNVLTNTVVLTLPCLLCKQELRLKWTTAKLKIMNVARCGNWYKVVSRTFQNMTQCPFTTDDISKEQCQLNNEQGFHISTHTSEAQLTKSNNEGNVKFQQNKKITRLLTKRVTGLVSILPKKAYDLDTSYCLAQIIPHALPICFYLYFMKSCFTNFTQC